MALARHPALARHLAFAAVLALGVGGPASLHAQQQPQQGGQTEEEEPTPAPLPVGSMAIASDAKLQIESMSVDVSVEHVAYSYILKNNGAAPLSLAASVALPDLEVNNEGTTFFVLPTSKPDNVVGLEVRSDGKPVATTPLVKTVALSIDRSADLKAEKIPLIPFGEETEKALAAAPPQTLEKLERLGLLIPRDPSQAGAPVVADWSLRVVHGWMQTLAPKADTHVTIGFMPIKAVYTIDASALPGFDALKEQVCLTPQIVAAVKALLRPKGSTADVADIALSNDGPARWLDNPPATISVHKPTPDTIVAFCGMDPASQTQPVVRGKMPGSNQAAGSRVLIFSRNPAQ